jgi:hypothetical protein
MTEGNDENPGIEGLPPPRVLTSDDRIEMGVEPEGIQGAPPTNISNHPNFPRLISTTVESSSLADGAGFPPMRGNPRWVAETKRRRTNLCIPR